MIEGSLQILLIQYTEGEVNPYENLSFPKLVEITEFLLLYRVYGLKSLKNIFPNLSVIGGQALFYNYALVVYEMIDMESLGLAGLTTIKRGAVRLEKNPNLCYIDTIDWKKIAKNIPQKQHIFRENKNSRECINLCNGNCTETMVDDIPSKRCWTKDRCQKFTGRNFF